MPKTYWPTSAFNENRQNMQKEQLQWINQKIEASESMIKTYYNLIGIFQVEKPQHMSSSPSCKIIKPHSSLSPLQINPKMASTCKPKMSYRKSTSREKIAPVQRATLKPSPPRSKYTDCKPLPPLAVTVYKRQTLEDESLQKAQTIIRISSYLYRIFQTKDPEEIANIMKENTIKNESYHERLEKLDFEIRCLLKKIDVLHSEYVCTGKCIYNSAKVIKAKQADLEQTKFHYTSERQEYKELLAQNRAISRGIRHVGEMLEIKSSTNPDVNSCKTILQKITTYFHKIEISDCLRHSRKLKAQNQPKRSGFQVVDSTSSSRKLLPMPDMSPPMFTPSVIPNDLFDIKSDKSASTSSHTSVGSDNDLVKVPSLSLLSSAGTSDYIPATRSTRRAFCSISSFRSSELDQTDVDQEMQLMGRIVGNLLVERYTPQILRFREDIKLVCHDGVDYNEKAELRNRLDQLPLNTFVSEMFNFYKKNTNNLHLLVFNDEEILQVDRGFFSFLSERQVYLDIYREKDEEEGLGISKQLPAFMLQDDFVACWLVRDIVMHCNSAKYVMKYLVQIAPCYQRKQNSITSSLTVNQAIIYAAYAALFAAFIDETNSSQVTQNVVLVVDENIAKLLSVFSRSVIIPMARAGIQSLFLIGRHLPHLFQTAIGFQNKATSILHNFILANNHYPSCIRASTELFAAVMRFLDEETVMWHTAIFYHFIIRCITNEKLSVDAFDSFLSVMTAIVANRHHFTVEQLGRLYFLPFLIENFQLEEFVSNYKVQPEAIEEEDKDDEDPSQIGNFHKTVTYLDIPKIPNLSCLPSLNLDNPKLQLHFQPKGESIAKNAVTLSDNEYQVKRKKYPIYSTDEIHYSFVQLLFATLIDHSLHRLDVFFCDPFPQVNRKPNILFTLMKHMENPSNSSVAIALEKEFTPPSNEEVNIPLIPTYKTSTRQENEPLTNSLGHSKNSNTESMRHTPLTMLESVVEEGLEEPSGEPIELMRQPSFPNNLKLQPFKSVPNFIALTTTENEATKSPHDLVQSTSIIDEDIAQFQDYKRLLRLVVADLFDPEQYSNGTHIASGAFGAVMAVAHNDKTLAVKILEKSRNTVDNPHLIEVFTEVSILEFCKGDRRVTQLIDYGCTADSYYIVMEFYPSNLKSWRKKLSNSENGTTQIDVLLRVFREFLNCCTILTEHRINHFDIKCDNVMLDCEGHPAIADFGESMSYKNEHNCYTLLNKGTEWIKSPEMLSIALNSSATNPNYDRRKKVGAGPASDIWSIGCLFYELMTGEYLFLDSDWSRFFFRITDNKKPLLTDKNKAMLDNNPKFISFIEFILQRSVRHRPDLQQVIVKFDEMFPGSMKGPLPVVKMPNFCDKD